jgi:predicted dehydrogenase
MNPKGTVSRRSFLASSAIIASGLTVSAKSYGRILGANERIGIGFIGAGGMGTNHLNACKELKDSNNLEFLGVADCWQARAEKGASLLNTDAVTDYRRLLDMKEVDYVTIATPEHRHAQLVIDALDVGKAVYCEKPLTRTIEEAQMVVKKRNDTGLAVQVGVQSMSDACYSSAAKAIASGVIGQVVQSSNRICPPLRQAGSMPGTRSQFRNAPARRSGLGCLARRCADNSMEPASLF